jgi:hypothetical protein
MNEEGENNDESKETFSSPDAPKKSGIGRATFALVLDAVDKANRRAASASEDAIEAVVESSKASQRRVFLIVLVVLLLLAAVIGITATVELPDGTSIGFDPASEKANEKKGKDP